MWTHVELMCTHVELMCTHVELMWTHVDLMWSSCGLRWLFPALSIVGPRTYGEVRRRGGRPSEAEVVPD